MLVLGVHAYHPLHAHVSFDGSSTYGLAARSREAGLVSEPSWRVGNGRWMKGSVNLYGLEVKQLQGLALAVQVLTFNCCFGGNDELCHKKNCCFQKAPRTWEARLQEESFWFPQTSGGGWGPVAHPQRVWAAPREPCPWCFAWAPGTLCRLLPKLGSLLP